MTTQDEVKHTPGSWTSHGIYEKENHFALHGIFDSFERAERHLKEVIPGYVEKSYFMDKTLTADSFCVLPYPRPKAVSSRVIQRKGVIPC